MIVASALESMKPRQTLLELFSSFLQFEGDRVHGWSTDTALRRSMEYCLKGTTSAEQSEHFWSLYWHKIWQNQPDSLAQAHLSAYLQEPCYWAARKTISQLANTQDSVADGFQLAILQMEKVLKGFNPDQGFRLKAYASTIFNSVIRETLRQRQEVDLCTDWSLLRKVSQKRLVEALQAVGLGADAIATHCLAWMCFKTLYVPQQATGTSKLSEPDAPTWDAIASLYHTQRTPTLLEGNPQSLRTWLQSSAGAIRRYLYPSLASLNTPIPGQATGEFVDALPNPQSDSLLADLIAQEDVQTRHHQQTQMQTMLVDAIAQMDIPTTQLLDLYYRQRLTQQQIAQHLNEKQYTISRRLTRTRDALLSKLAQWSTDTLHISLDSEVLKGTSTLLEEWLITHYHPEEHSPLIERCSP
jgi:RNA polymerase sigma factor (sigma-70 family)